ncbi:hypothetical protein TrCOL_g13720 [Triparma columacea]|uniref:Uncharacterized protein n=1 Tax=Triparma columacea TaxID=722753 RepID=A0A9W7LG21_9STRA|nr:hypothetical protein TrCOL_g13720 [Triparma columacea]
MLTRYKIMAKLAENGLSCPVYKIPFDMTLGNHDKNLDNSMTIDKFIAARSYVAGNWDVISFRANKHKSDSSLEEIKELYAYMQGKAAANVI